MPNRCYTKFIFHGNKGEITDLYNKITEWTSKNYVKNGFGGRWLGNILHGAGLGDRIDAEENDLRCRGSINWYELDSDEGMEEGLLYIDTETAWVPMARMWEAVIGKLEYSTVGFSYISEEPGCGVYEICDPYGDFPERYHVDIYLGIDDEKNPKLTKIRDTQWYVSDEELYEALAPLANKKGLTLKSLIDKAQSYPFKDDESYLSVIEYAVVLMSDE